MSRKINQKVRLYISSLTSKQKSKVNQKAASAVNMTYAIAMLIEGIAVDLQDDEIAENAIELRSFIGSLGEKTSENFGNWTDIIEEFIFQMDIEKSELLTILAIKLYYYAAKMQDIYRQFEPRFDFDQMPVVLKIYKKFANEFFKESNFKKISELLTIIQKS